MTLIFFTIAALMVILALAMIVPAMTSSRGTIPTDRNAQNVWIARERLAELEAQVEAGQGSMEELEQARLEIERALLDDLGSSANPDAAAASANAGQWAGWLVAAVLPLATGMLYLALGAPGAVVSSPEATLARERAPHPLPGEGGTPSVAEMIARLETRLQETPDDANGWFTLANAYMAIQRFPDAAATYAKVRGLVGDNPDLLVRQADALAMAAGGVLQGEPERLVLQALAHDPAHPTGLWLAGLAANRRGDNRKALEYWRRAEPLFVNDAESHAELQQLIARAEGAGETATPARDSKAAIKLTVNVSLADTLAEEVSPGDTLFILARAMRGPPMPLAVSRRQVGELPLTVTLDDSMAMMPSLQLSKFEEVRVIARISKSGDAIANSGDLFGEVAPVATTGGGPVNIEIAQRVP